jgi:CBS domain containing-hemolysin-like protein
MRLNILRQTIKSLIQRYLISSDDSLIYRQIQSIIDIGEKRGLIDSESSEMIQSVLEFKNTIVREIMIPRTEMIALKSNAEIEEIVDLIIKYGHTRMPVYAGSIDNIIGILNVKDLLRVWLTPFMIKDFITNLRKPYYIPETKKALVLLQELKQKKYHMAIVIDEYGGTAGLVTLEDLIEEIVGEIHDEHDSANQNTFFDLQNGYTRVDGRMDIEEIEHYFGVTFPEDKYETLGGLILHELKKIPVEGESIKINNLDMIIESANERSIKKVKIKKSQ